jgi:hypothetical protein
LEHGCSESVADRAITILNLDNAIEMFLYALLDYIGAKEPQENFSSLLIVFKNKVAEIHADFDLSLFHEVEIKNMHRARNNVQHHGIVPSIDDVERYRTVTYEVLSNLSRSILGIEFEEISLSGMIKDELVRTLYKKAEQAYFSANYEEALICIASAFEKAKSVEQSNIHGSGLMWAVFGQQQVDAVTTKLIEEVEILKLRLDYKKYQKYRDIFNHTLEPFTSLSSYEIDSLIIEIGKLTASSVPSWRRLPKEQLKKETIFCLAFVIDSILRWETVTRTGSRG